jgi:hypothetical protein
MRGGDACLRGQIIKCQGLFVAQFANCRADTLALDDGALKHWFSPFPDRALCEHPGMRHQLLASS